MKLLKSVKIWNGLGVLKRLNTMNIYPMSRIIILSVVSESGLIRKALALGVERYLVKPFKLNKFINEIKKMFDNTLNNDDINQIT